MNNIKGITVELGGDTTKLSSALKGVNKDIRDLQSELKQINTQLKFNPGSTELLAQKQKVLKESVDATKQKLEQLKSMESQVKQQFASGNLGEEKYRAFEREIEQTKDKLKGLQKQAQEFGSVAGQQFQLAGEKIKSSGDKIGGVGQKLMPVSTAAAGVGAAAVKMSSDFETSGNKVSTIADTTQVSMDTLEKGVLNLSTKTGESASGLNEALYQTISAGVQTKDAVSVLGTAVETAKGGFTDTSTAIDTLTTVMNSYQMKTSEAKHVSDLLIQTQNLGKTTVGQLGQSLGNVIPTASAAGVSFQDLMGSIAELTKQGLPTSEAITGMKAALSNVIKPTSDAAQTAEKLGINFNQAHLKSVGWAQFLTEVKEKTGGNVTTMGKLFGSVEALNAVTVLAGKGSKDFASVLDQMGKSAGTTDSAVSKMEKGTGASFERAMNSMKNAAIQLGTALAPVAQKIAQVIQQIAQKLNSLSPAQQQLIAKILLVVAAVGPALIVAGKMITAIGSIVKVVGLLMHPVGAVIAIIGVAVAAIKHLWDTNIGFRNGVINIWNGIKSFFQGIPGFFQNLWNTITGFFKGIPAFFQNLGNSIKSGITGALKNAQSSIVGTLQSANDSIIENSIFGDAAQSEVDGFFDDLNTKVNNSVAKNNATLAGGITKINDSLGSMTNDVQSSVEWIGTTFLTVFKDIFTGNFSDIPKQFANLFRQLGQNAQDFILSFGKLFAGLGQSLLGVFQGIGNTVLNALKTAWAKVVSFFTQSIPAAINAVGQWFQQLPYKIGYAIGLAIGSVMKLGTSIKNWATTQLPQLINNIVQWFQQLPGKIWSSLVSVVTKIGIWGTNMLTTASSCAQQTITGVLTWFQQLPGRIWGFLTQAIQHIKNWGTQTANNAKVGAQNAIVAVLAWFQQLPGKIWGFLTQVIQHVKDWATQTLNSAKSGAQNVITAVTGFFQQLPGKIWNELVKVVTNIGKWIGNMSSFIASNFPRIVSSIVGFFQSIPGKMLNIGSNIVHGIWNGISGAAGWLWNQITGFCNGIVNGIKSALGIHSPSRVMADVVGKNMVLGIGQGFADNMQSVTGTMSDSLRQSIGGLTATVPVTASLGAQYAGATAATASSIVPVQPQYNINVYAQDINNPKRTAQQIGEELDFLQRRKAAAYGTA